MNTTSRNELCPCGSGKKYKRCCLGQAEPAQTETGRLAHVRNATERGLFERILAWTDRRFGRNWATAAMEATGEAPPSRTELQFLLPWLVYLMPIEGVSPAGHFFLEMGARLSDSERDCLRASIKSRLGYWEVRRVETGVGAELLNLLTHETCFVHEVRASRTLQRWHVLLAAITTYPEVSVFTGLHPTALMPGDATGLVVAVRRALRVGKRPVLPIRLAMPELQLALIRNWRQTSSQVLERMSRPPELANTDGDPLVMCTDHFAPTTESAEAALALLGQMADADLHETDEQAEVVFLRPGNRLRAGWSNTVVGRAFVRRGRLLVETNSMARADALRARIEHDSEARLCHLMRDVQDIGHLLRNPPPEARTHRRSAAVPPELQEHLRQMQERDWQEWLDMKVPALGNRTPREAAASARLRPSLVALLKEFEIRETAKPKTERYDLSQLWSALGLDADDAPATGASTVGVRRTTLRKKPIEQQARTPRPRAPSSRS